MEGLLFVLLLSVLCVIASLLFGVWITIASVNYKLGLIRDLMTQIASGTTKLCYMLQAPDKLGRLAEIELPVLCAALQDLVEAMGEEVRFNPENHKN